MSGRLLRFRPPKKPKESTELNPVDKFRILFQKREEAKKRTFHIATIIQPLNKELGTTREEIYMLREKYLRPQYKLDDLVNDILGSNEIDWRKHPDLYQAVINEFWYQLLLFQRS